MKFLLLENLMRKTNFLQTIAKVFGVENLCLYDIQKFYHCNVRWLGGKKYCDVVI